MITDKQFLWSIVYLSSTSHQKMAVLAYNQEKIKATGYENKALF